MAAHVTQVLGWPLWLWVTLAAVLGLALGSFAGLVVHRLPRKILAQSTHTLSWPPSHCASCEQRLRWWHNVPLLSYLVLRGRCGFCGTPIGRLNFWIEVALGSLWAGMVAGMGPTATAAAWACFFSVLLVLCVIDWQTFLLPDVMTWPLMLLGLICASNQWITLSGTEAWVGALLGYGMLKLVAWAFERVRGISGMGGGDPKLMSALGAWLGAQALVWVLLLSSLLHVAWIVVTSRMAQTAQPAAQPAAQPNATDDDLPEGAVPFGPALIVAAALVWAGSVWASPAWAESSAKDYPFKVHTLQAAESSQVVADNDGDAVVSVEVHLEGRNVASDQSWPVRVVVPARSRMTLAQVFAADASQSYEFSVRSARTFGDLHAQVDGTPFRLPFANGQQFVIGQAFGGNLTTHQDPTLQHAVDFDLPEGTPVMAARDGWVVEMDLGHTQGGPDARYANEANWVKVLHRDGTVATYAHLSPQTPVVSLGQRVQAGDMLAYSGNTGYSSGPHLHFCVSKPVVQTQGMTDACLPIQFVTGVPPQVWTPQEGWLVQANDQGPATVKPVAHDGAKTAVLPVWGGQAVGEWSHIALDLVNEWPWWAWLALSVLLLLWLVRAFR